MDEVAGGGRKVLGMQGDVEGVLAVEVAGLAAVFVGVVERAGLGELDAGESGIGDGEEKQVAGEDVGAAGLVAEVAAGEGAEKLFGGPLGGVHVG